MYVLVFTCFPLLTLGDKGIYGNDPYENAYQRHHQMPKHKNKKYFYKSFKRYINHHFQNWTDGGQFNEKHFSDQFLM